MNLTALTPAEQEYASENHNLIYTFLNESRLDEDDFYDIVVFGFLRAVKRYLNNSGLSHKYAFSTIAWGDMKSALANHFKSISRQKRKGYTVSMETYYYDKGTELLPLHEVVAAADPLMLAFEEELLLHEIAARVSRRQMDIIRLKSQGYGVRQIASVQKIPIRDVQETLSDVKDTVIAVCFG